LIYILLMGFQLGQCQLSCFRATSRLLHSLKVNDVVTCLRLIGTVNHREGGFAKTY